MVDMQREIEGLMNYVRDDAARGTDQAARGTGEALVRAASSQLRPLELF
jgi:hypothetical protein